MSGQTAERNAAIHRMRQEGRTLRSLGDEFELYPERIRQICAKIDRINDRTEKLQSGGLEAWEELTPRAQNGLINSGKLGTAMAATPQFVAETFSEALLRTFPNMGRKSIKDIDDWLSRHGFEMTRIPRPYAQPKHTNVCPHCGGTL